MKLPKLLISFLLILGSIHNQAAFAQQKIMNERDAAGLNYKLYPKSLSQLQWINGVDQFSWIDGKLLLKGSAAKQATDTLINLDQLNSWMIAAGADSLRQLPVLQWRSSDFAMFQVGYQFFNLNFQTQNVSLFATLPADADNIEPSGKGLKIAYTILNNLFVFDGINHHQITDEPEGVVCGQSVHRNEFGINGGIFWSPDESKIAYYVMDERMVTNYPLVDVSKRIAKPKMEPYPMAGMTSHQVSLFIYDIENKINTKINVEGPNDQYLTSVSWHPGSKSIFTAVLNRDQNHLQLRHYNAINGQFIALLFEEHDEHYVEPQHPLYFLPQQTDRFIWVSDRNGYKHLYLYNTRGELIQQLTNGEWEITSVLGFDPRGEYVLFGATKESPLQQNTYSLRIKNSSIKRLTSQKGVHRSMLSPSGNYLLDIYSNLQVPRETLLIDLKGKQSRLLHQAENPLDSYLLGTTEIFSIQASDSTPLFCRLIKPADFDPQKKYPVIIYVYGGPHAQLITDSWMGGANFYLNYLAQKGYAVFTLDNRGSAGRGKAFEQMIHRRLGQTEMEDQMQGVAYLKSLPWVDSERIGVDGWSYGGFMSVNLKLNHPDVFKVAVAGGPVIDWQLYEVMYGERYMDRPDENPEGYAKANLLLQADKLEGKLLLIHGDMDPVVVWQHSLQFIKACIKAGKLVDYFVYPGHEHNVRGSERAHLIMKISNYFDENL